MILAIKSSLALPFKHVLWCAAVLIGSGGCGAEEGKVSQAEYDASRSVVGAASPPAATAPAEGASATPPAQPRRIIYNAQVTLVVESLTGVSQQINQLVQASGGYVSETDTNMQTHAPRTGTWKVRVPVARFDSFMASVTKLGELQHNHVDSQDVSQEYYDLEARISNKQQEEKRLLKHLSDSTGKLEDILAVERELSRVRGEVEQMQGRIRFLTHQTDLSTVTITATEVKDYKPPVSPTLSTEITRTFGQSVGLLGDFGRGLLLFFVAAAPWFVVIGFVAVPLWWLTRRRWLRARV
ncbi:protein of unknown function [Singulisphaera sp. GP187]|uniref:DUF4349 domain-containing protein n=1 Tax=Singulisphaera sp. GP187 TaxID=1882752 RepID=UPI000925C4B2|nr:DUF4349 domain-containing protein [Singulisphaera sp. GP187]SIO59785.1 protein of unknown function [Singulisphaera sp. GP187]